MLNVLGRRLRRHGPVQGRRRAGLFRRARAAQRGHPGGDRSRRQRRLPGRRHARHREGLRHPRPRLADDQRRSSPGTSPPSRPSRSFVAVFVVLVSLLTDVVYAALDPRVDLDSMERRMTRRGGPTATRGDRRRRGPVARACALVPQPHAGGRASSSSGSCCSLADRSRRCSPLQPDRSRTSQHTLQSPSAHHWLGTDKFGRDVLTRLLYGARVDLRIGFLAVLFPFVLGSVLGASPGYFGGWFDPSSCGSSTSSSPSRSTCWSSRWCSCSARASSSIYLAITRRRLGLLRPDRARRDPGRQAPGLRRSPPGSAACRTRGSWAGTCCPT